MFAVAAVVAAVTGLGSWRRREGNPAAGALAVIMGAIAVWSADDAVVLAASSPELRRVLLAVQLAAVGVAVLGLVALPRLLADPSWRPGRYAWWLAAEPLAIVPLAALPATAGLVYHQDLITGDRLRLAGGPLFAVHTAYCYVLLASSLVLLVRRRRATTGTFRRQAGVLLLSAVPPVVTNVVVTVLESHRGAVPLTPLGFLATGLIAGYAVFRMGVLRLVPVARGQVVETMTDAVLVSDPAGRLLDLNPAARRMLAALRPELAEAALGCTLAELAGPEVLEAVRETGAPVGGRVIEVSPGVHIDVRTTPVTDPRGRPLGKVSVLRDVSESQRRHDAVAALNGRLAEQLAVIERLKADLAEEAVRDHLTGLYNRRHLDRVLAEALAGEPVGVVLVDIDHFKRVNDRFGHAAGDQVLRGVAGVLRASTRPADTIARLGGEEFVLLLPGADREQARQRAEALRAACGQWDHQVPGGTLRVTVSAGVAAAPDDGADAAALLDACDRALYAAKAAGRDRVATTVTSAPAPAAR
jgi:diguanylate cyclase (GGDEF)-like protein